MKILHYILGFPPYRSGGMTKFAIDLIKEESVKKHDVYVLWPGMILNFDGRTKIKKRRDVKGIQNYELINPLPIPLDEGISEFQHYMKPCDKSIYMEFLTEISPDVIHIHTLMGIHSEFIKAAKEMGIRTIFSTHDYFGICPKVTLYRQGSCCDDDKNCNECINCNLSALSMRKIMILQSPIYRFLKDSKLVTMVRKRHRNKFYEEDVSDVEFIGNEYLAKQYKKLRSYYIDMLELIDFIHFNSHLTEKVYRKYLSPNKSEIIPISHRNISVNKIKKNKKSEEEKKVFIYLAQTKSYKGFDVLKKALDSIWENNKNFELRVYTNVVNPSPYMVIRESGFNYDELKNIMNDADLLIAPSNCYETFGFTVLEALSFGVPVLVSNNVGAVDIVGDAGIIFSAGDDNELKDILNNLDSEKLYSLSKNAFNLNINTWENFVDDILELYQDN